MRQEVVGVEIAPQPFFIERIRKSKVPVVIGDARIQTVFSTSALAAPALAAAATRAAIEYSFYVNDVLLNVSRITVAEGSPLAGQTVGAVEQEADLSIILHEGAAGVDLHPAADKVLTAGDHVVVFGTLEALACLSQMNVVEGACPPRRSGLFSRRRGRE